MNIEVENRVTNLRETITRLESELRQAKRDLAHAYEDRFPKGRFFIVRYKPNHWNNPIGVLPPLYFEMCYEGSQRKRIVITTKANGHKKVEGYPTLEFKTWRSRMRHMGCLTTQYDSLEKLKDGAKRLNVPAVLFEAFEEHFKKVMMPAE